MTDRELQLIMAAFENHRQDVRADLGEIKESIKSQAVVVQAHEHRFAVIDTTDRIRKRIGAALIAIASAIWAVFTYFDGGKP